MGEEDDCMQVMESDLSTIVIGPLLSVRHIFTEPISGRYSSLFSQSCMRKRKHPGGHRESFCVLAVYVMSTSSKLVDGL